MHKVAILLVAFVLGGFGHAHSQERREISFPDTKGGLHVLSVDTHVHTAFSDGHVWPNVRALEAVRDHLDALAITDHIDTQAHHDDVPNPDRNRSFDLTRTFAQSLQAPLIVIRGVEIAHPTKDCGSCSHFNALFTRDNTPLRHREWDPILPWKSGAPLQDAVESIEAAKKQGAFIIWNHPGEEFPVKLTEYNRTLLREKLIDGIEVVNGPGYWEGAYQFALDNNLAIIGASDSHDAVNNMLTGEALYQGIGGPMDQRPATLVLAQDKGEAAIKQAFEAHRTVALYRHTLIGRECEVRPIVEAALSLKMVDSGVNGPKMKGSDGPPKWVIRNAASSPFLLRRVRGDRIYTAGPLIEVPAHGEVAIWLLGGGDAQPPSLTFEILNALTAPQRPLQITLKQ